MLSQGFEYHNGNGTLCLIGDYDKETGTFLEEHNQSIDYGIDFYAPQTVLTPDGRRVMIGWMQNWDTCNHRRKHDEAWFGQMSLPRELSIRNGGRRVDMEIVVRPVEGCDMYRKFAVRFAQNELYQTSFSYRPSESVLKVDRKFSGSRRAIIHQKRSKVELKDGVLKLRIILDRFSVEAFINDGEQVMSAVLYTDQEADGIFFSADGTVSIDVVKYDLI